MKIDKLEKLFKENKLDRIWSLLKSKAKNSILIKPKITKEENIKIGSSKIGGSPDLPKNINWFKYNDKPMSFLAQINLEEIEKFDIDNRLPKKGILYFFYDAEQEVWGFDPKDKEGSKVFYFKGSHTELERKSKPKELDEYSYFNSCKVKFELSIDIPDFQSSLTENIVFTDEEYENYENLINEIYEDEIFKLLGHSNNIQGGMELECELVTNGLYCGNSSGYQDPKRKELENNVELWNLLFQFDSSDEIGTMFGDCGRLYYWIRENDLVQERFDNIWAILQCY